MTGLVPILILAAACWLMRMAFIVCIPAERLPRRVMSALDQLAPAVLAALVSVETVGMVRVGAPLVGLAALGCVAVIAGVAYRRPSLTVSAGLGIAAVMLIDLALA
jgi:branched-subunit amino acid transport protein